MHSTVLAHARTYSLVSPHTHSCINCTLSHTHKTVHSHAYVHALLYSVIHSLFSKAHTLLSSHMYTYLYAHMHSHSLMCSHICMHSHLHCHIYTTLWLVFAHTTCTIAYSLAQSIPTCIPIHTHLHLGPCTHGHTAALTQVNVCVELHTYCTPQGKPYMAQNTTLIQQMWLHMALILFLCLLSFDKKKFSQLWDVSSKS